MPLNTNVGESSSQDSAEYVLKVARALVNDMADDVDGDVLTDDAPFAQVLLNTAYRRVQNKLAINGVETQRKTVILENLPAIPATGDPSDEAVLSTEGYYDGRGNNASPSLPADLIIPLKLWERPTGQSTAFAEMQAARDTLPMSNVQSQLFRMWDWMGDAIVLPSVTQANDLRIMYLAYFPELTAPFDKAVIRFRRAVLPLAYYLAGMFCAARGAAAAEGLIQLGDNEINDIISLTVIRKQRRPVYRRPFGGGGNSRAGGR